MINTGRTKGRRNNFQRLSVEAALRSSTVDPAINIITIMVRLSLSAKRELVNGASLRESVGIEIKLGVVAAPEFTHSRWNS